MTTEKGYTIYGVADPRTGDIRYIGQTKNVKARRKSHISGSCSGKTLPVSRWERKLRQEGVLPTFVILQEGIGREDINRLEAEWIAKGRAEGWSLLNLIDGATSEPHGCPLSDERRAKIAESMRRRWEDPAFRAEKTAKIRVAMAEPGYAEKHRAAIVGRVLSDETKAKVSEGVRALWEDPEYRSSQGEAVRAGLEKTRANTEAEAKRLATIRTEEHRAKIGEKSRQMWQNPESRAKLMEARRTQARPSEESRRKTGESLRRAYAEGRMTRERTEAERQKTSDGMKRAYAEGRRARVYSEAHRRAISEGLKKAFAERKRRKAAGE
jgi:hypothetical protein